MSGFASEPVRTDEQAEYATFRDGASVHPMAQRHERDSSSSANGTVTGSEGEIDISASQRMLSAVSGSLLTSILGIHPQPIPSNRAMSNT